MNKKLLSVIIILIVFLNLAHARTEILVFDDAHQPFMHMGNSNDVKTMGFYPNLVKAVYNHLKIAIEVKPQSQRLARQQAEKGKVLGIIGIYNTKQNHEDFWLSEPMFHEEFTIIMKKNNEFVYNDLRSLNGKVIGLIQGWSYGDKIDQLVANKSFLANYSKNASLSLKKLLADKVDAIIMERHSAKILIEDMEIRDKVIILPKVIERLSTHVGFSKSIEYSQSELKKFNSSLDAIKNSFIYNKLITNHIPKLK